MELVEVENNMKYRVKVKGGVSVFHDKELAEKCAKKNKTKVEEITDVKINEPVVPRNLDEALSRQEKKDK